MTLGASPSDDARSSRMSTGAKSAAVFENELMELLVSFGLELLIYDFFREKLFQVLFSRNEKWLMELLVHKVFSEKDGFD